ncbi:MAG: type I protein secretion system protein AggA [Calditrichia bacterium]
MRTNLFWKILDKLGFARLLFLFILPAGIVWAQEITLQEAFNTALQNNPDIRVALNNMQAAQNSAHPGNAGLLPSLNATAGVNYSETEPGGAGGPVSKSTFNSAGVELSYNLFNGFADINTWLKLQKQADYTSLLSRLNIEQTLLQVARGYYNLANAEENLRLSRESLTISRERLQRIRHKAQFGQTNSIDLLNAKVDYNSDSTAYLAAVLTVDEARRNLNTLLYRETDLPVSVNKLVEFESLPPADSLLRLAEKANAAYLASRKEKEIAGKNVAIANAAFLPKLNFKIGYGVNQTRTDFKPGFEDPATQTTASLNLSYNLFSGFQHKIARQNAKLNLNSAEIRAQQQRLQLEADVKNAYQAYENSRFIYRVEEQNLKTAELNFQRSRELYELGQITSTQFREAQLNYFSAQSRWLNARYNAKLNELTLKQLSGILLKDFPAETDRGSYLNPINRQD